MPGLNLSGLAPLAESLVFGERDIVRITRPGDGDPILDPATKRYVDPPRVTVYEGPGAVIAPGTQPSLALPVAGQLWADDTKVAYRLLTPVTAPVPARDQQVEVVSSELDASLAGRTWRCVQPGQGSTFAVLRVTWLDENQPDVGEGQ